MLNLNPPKIGQRVIVRGITCEVFRVHPLGTLDVVSLCGQYAFRISGLSFYIAPIDT